MRGFLARAISRRLIGLRDALRQWVNPQYAKEYMRNFLSSKASLGAMGLGQGHNNSNNHGPNSIKKLDFMLAGIDRSALLNSASVGRPVDARGGTANGTTPLGDPPSASALS